MYKYFSELDTPNDFKIYLKKRPFDIKSEYRFSNVLLPESILFQYKKLFKRLDAIDKFIEITNEKKFQSCFTYEAYEALGYLLSFKEDTYHFIKRDKNKVVLTSSDIYNLMINYLRPIDCLKILYPELKMFFEEIKEMIIKTKDDIKKISTIKISSVDKAYIYKSPNAWYITPKGFLYNTGSDDGHKMGNLVYPFNQIIEILLEQNSKISNMNLNEKINEIQERGFITKDEFSNYANLIYELPTIITPEIEHEIEKYNYITKLSKEEFDKIESQNFPSPYRSYQTNLITLVTGHLSAMSSLYESFSKLNVSNRKAEICNEILSISQNYLADILVRYCGFHKIESTIDKTITTSSLYGISLLKNYLDKGWNLNIVPGITYDKFLDEISEVDLNSYFIEKHLEEELSQYKGKGKILIFKDYKSRIPIINN